MSAALRAGDEFSITLDKAIDPNLGILVDAFNAKDGSMPITQVNGGLAEIWNRANPEEQVLVGDQVVEVNGCRGDVSGMLGKCKRDSVLRLIMRRGGNIGSGRANSAR